MKRIKIIAAGGLVFNERNELLMIFRRGYWDLPKGKLDAGETIEDCAVREVMEETGLQQVKLKKLIGITKHDYFDNRLKEEAVKETHWYEMHAPSSEKLIPQTEEDIEKIEWVNKIRLIKKLRNSYKNISEIVEKSGFAEI